MKPKNVLQVAIVAMLFYLIYKEKQNKKTLTSLTKSTIIPSLDLVKKIDTDYVPVSDDRGKMLLVINPLKLTFLQDGNYNVIVRTNPVSIYNSKELVQELEVGNYFIDVKESTITII